MFLIPETTESYNIGKATKITTNTISEVTHYTAVSIEPNMSQQIIQEIKSLYEIPDKIEIAVFAPTPDTGINFKKTSFS